MLEAGIIKHVEPSLVKCVSPTMLAQKAHECGGLTLEELKQRINAECAKAGIDPYFNGGGGIVTLHINTLPKEQNGEYAKILVRLTKSLKSLQCHKVIYI